MALTLREVDALTIVHTAARRLARCRMSSLSVSDDLVLRVKSEFLEMPGLKLTHRQAERLWALDSATCETVIQRLTEMRFLARTEDGAIVRRSS